MIIARITGGLGNQMFQYVIAKSISKKNNDEFKLDISFYPNQKLRKYELNVFNIEENIASIKETELLAGKNDIISKLKSKIGFMHSKPSTYYKERELSVFDNNVFGYKDDVYLDGYWQSEKYFEYIREEILKDFTLKESISDEAKRYLLEIKNTNSISLHVRRGDYVENSHTNSVHGVCDLNYYKRAIKHLNGKINDANYYIFSDDIKWCKDNFGFLERKVFVDDTKSALDDLELMKNCNHNIIANSTFSWWGAWLNENDNKIVVSPKNWFADEYMQEQAKDLIPEKWLRL